MVNLPQRFVPSSNQILSPAHLVSQTGHDTRITAVSFSPCLHFFASADADGWVKIWNGETLDVLGSYLLDFECSSLVWDGLHALVCRGTGSDAERRIVLDTDQSPASSTPDAPDPSRVIRLIGAPELETSGDTLRVLYNDESMEYGIPGLARAALEPCERYGVAMGTRTLIVVSAFEREVLVELKAPEGQTWCDFVISWRGDFVAAVASDGSIWEIIPLKRESRCLHHETTQATALAFGSDTLVLVGDYRGNLSIYDLARHALLLRTPRCLPNFVARFASPRRPGFIGIRPESLTAYFGHSQEILTSAPLPALCRASAPATAYCEIAMACEDGGVYRLKLDTGFIRKCFDTPTRVVAVAASDSAVATCDADGRVLICDDRKLSKLSLTLNGEPSGMAISDDASGLAFLVNGSLILATLPEHDAPVSIAMPGVVAMAFVDSSDRLFAVTQTLHLLVIHSREATVTDLGVIPVEHARPVSISRASDHALYLLCATEHGQDVIVRVDPESMETTECLRILSQNRQIWATSDKPQKVSIRNDATALRIVHGLQTFSPDDWSRSEPVVSKSDSDKDDTSRTAWVRQ